MESPRQISSASRLYPKIKGEELLYFLFEFVGGESFRRGVRIWCRRARFCSDRGAAVHKSAKDAL